MAWDCDNPMKPIPIQIKKVNHDEPNIEGQKWKKKQTKSKIRPKKQLE